MDIQASSGVEGTPVATKAILVGTLVGLAGALAAFAAASGSNPVAGSVLGFLTLLFLVRVAGQVLVALRGPAWLPAMADWNFVPYRILLPVQLVLLGVMSALCVAVLRDWHAGGGKVLVGASFLYWAAMVVRYSVRMSLRPAARWFGGAIPIVFHCVLAGFLFVLGASLASG